MGSLVFETIRVFLSTLLIQYISNASNKKSNFLKSSPVNWNPLPYFCSYKVLRELYISW